MIHVDVVIMSAPPDHVSHIGALPTTLVALVPMDQAHALADALMAVGFDARTANPRFIETQRVVNKEMT